MSNMAALFYQSVSQNNLLLVSSKKAELNSAFLCLMKIRYKKASRSFFFAER